MKFSKLSPFLTLLLSPKVAPQEQICTIEECSEDLTCDAITAMGMETFCFCGVVPQRRELAKGARVHKARKMPQRGGARKLRNSGKGSGKGSARGCGSGKGKGKGDSRDEMIVEPISGFCGACPNANIACNECTEPGETCCDFSDCPASERQCICQDLDIEACDSCSFGGTFHTGGQECCTNELGITSCPSCSDQLCLNCNDCTLFQAVGGVQCCDDEGEQQNCGGLIRRDRILEETPNVHASDSDTRFSQAQGVLPRGAMSNAVSFVEEQFRAKESTEEKDLSEFKIFVEAETIVDLLGKRNVQNVLNMLYDHVGNEKSPVTSVFFQRFQDNGEHASPYHTVGQGTTSLVILLNDDYEGGEMTYLTEGGPKVIASVVGAATVHGPRVAFRNFAVKGIKYQLTFSTISNIKKECMFAEVLED